MRTIAVLLMAGLPALAGYSWCQPLVIQHAKVPNTDQPNYVLTVSDTDPQLATSANGGYVRNSNGYDIVFASDNQGRNLLNWDPLEVYNPATGQIVTHVQVGLAQHAADTTIYRCAGNAGITTFQGGNTGSVWPLSYRMVWHLGNGSVLSASDATSNGANGVIVSASAVSGKIGGAATFNGTNGRITNSAFSGPSPSISIEGWIKPVGYDGSQRVIVQGGSSSDQYIRLELRGGKFSSQFGNGSSWGPSLASQTTVTNGSWYHVVAIHDGPSGLDRIFVNGALENSVADTTPISNSPGIILGAYLYDGYNFPGILDEFRLANTALSADRISTDYNNQNNPGAFYSPGAWVTAIAATPSQIFVF